MKYLLLAGFMCISLRSISQLPNTLLRCENEFIVNSKEVKLNSFNSLEFLKGVSYSFNGKLINVEIDTVLDNLILFLKYKDSQGYKEIISYNPETDSTYWKYKSFAQSCYFDDDYAVLKYIYNSPTYTKYFILDRKTGTPRSVKENVTMVPIPEKEVFLSFSNIGLIKKVTINNKFNGFELGKTIIGSEFAYTGYHIHDSILMLIINGIHAFNQNYDLIWKTDLKTMELNVGSILLTTGFGLGIGMLTGITPFIFAPNYSIGLQSNIIMLNNNLIISDRNYMYSFDILDGKTIWKNKLPEKAGFSYLYGLDETKSLFFNSGLCLKNGRPSEFCKPYFTICDLTNGSYENFTLFEESKYISDILKKDSSTLLLFDNRIVGLENSTIVYDKIFETNNNYGEFYSFLDNIDIKLNYFDTLNAEWVDFYLSRNLGEDFFVTTSKGILVFNHDFHIKDFISANRLGFVLYESKKYKYIESYKYVNNFFSFDKLIKYNKEKKENIAFDINWKYEVNGNKLYIEEKESISIYDLD